MGSVHRLYYLGSVGFTSGFEALTNAIVALNGSSPAAWSVQVAVLRPVAQPADGPKGDVCAVTFSECPGQVFLVSRAAQEVVQAEESVLPLLEKYKAYTPRTVVHMEGLLYRVGDFTAGLARAVQRPGERILGAALDTAYLPLGAPGEAAPVLQDLGATLQEVLGAAPAAELRPAGDDVGGFALPPGGAWHRAAVQYVQLASRLLGHVG